MYSNCHYGSNSTSKSKCLTAHNIINNKFNTFNNNTWIIHLMHTNQFSDHITFESNQNQQKIAYMKTNLSRSSQVFEKKKSFHHNIHDISSFCFGPIDNQRNLIILILHVQTRNFLLLTKNNLIIRVIINFGKEEKLKWKSTIYFTIFMVSWI